MSSLQTGRRTPPFKVKQIHLKTLQLPTRQFQFELTNAQVGYVSGTKRHAKLQITANMRITERA